MLKLFTLFTAALQESNDLLSEEQQSQLKQLQESKNVDTEVLIPVSLSSVLFTISFWWILP